jgi:hypothetical protein
MPDADRRKHRRQWTARSVAAAWLTTLLAQAVAAQAQPEVQIEVELQRDGAIAVAAHCPPGRQVLVVAGPPWQGHEPLPAGRVSLQIDQAQREAGAGLLLQALSAGPTLRQHIPSDTVARLPSQLVVQAIAATASGGSFSNAFVFERVDGAATIRPWDCWFSLGQIRGRLLLLAALALAGGWLWWWRPLRRQLPTQWLLLPAAGLLLARALVPTGIPMWPQPPALEELQQLEQALGPGVADIVAAVRSHRTGAEPVAVVTVGALSSTQVQKVAHWHRLLPGAEVHRDDTNLPPHGLIVRIAGTAGAATADPAPTGGTLVCRTADATVWQRRQGPGALPATGTPR